MTVSPKLKALFDEDLSPGEMFHDTVREIKRCVRTPGRVKTVIPRRGRVATNSRLLSYKEMGAIEKRLIDEGLRLKPMYSNRGGKKMRKNKQQVRERVDRLHGVVKEVVKANGFFKTGVFDEKPGLQNRVTDSPLYFNRTIYEDLRRLAKDGLIYRRGRGVKSAYYLGDGKDAPKVEVPIGKSCAKTEARLYDCLGIMHDQKDECGKCHYRKTCFDVKSRMEKVVRKAEQHREPLIPTHITVDVNVTFRLGMR